MASLLRGFRYPFGYFSSIARNVARRETTRINFVKSVQCLCVKGLNGNGYATEAARQVDSLESSLRRLDNDVKRSGRISMQDIEEVLEQIRTQKFATSTQALLVIRCCGNLVPEELPEARTKLVQEIWKTLNKLKLPMDISHYNALLRVYLENEHTFSPIDFLADLSKKGIEPNRVTYQRLISRYCQQGDIEGATKILECMREKEMPVNENVFNALIMGHSQAGDMDSANGILQVMSQAGLEPSSDTYTTLLCGYAKQGNMDKIKDIIEACKNKEIILLGRNILEVVYNLSVNGHAGLVDFLLEGIQKTAGYNQDAINVILRLINKGQEDVALKVSMTMESGARQDSESRYTGAFMIKQLVKANRSLDAILKVCQKFEESGTNSRSILIALETALSSGNKEISLGLLKELNKSGEPLRQHFFWPLICNAKTNKDISSILRMMQEEFQLPVNSETIKDFVLPNLKNLDYEKTINLLSTTGVSSSIIIISVVHRALMESNFAEAARLANTYNLYYSPKLFGPLLIRALDKTKDFDAYVSFLRQIYDSFPRKSSMSSKIETNEEIDETEEASLSEEESKRSQSEILGRLVYDASSYFKSNRAEMLHKILDRLVKQGLTISDIQAMKIKEQLGSSITSEISTLLDRLASGELQPSEIDRPTRIRIENSQMNSSQLEMLIKKRDARGEGSNALKRDLLFKLIRENNAEKLESYVIDLQSNGFVLSSPMKAQIAEMYAKQENHEKAIEFINDIKKSDPEFLLEPIKTLRIAKLYLDQDRLDDAVKFLEEHKPDKVVSGAFNHNTTVWRLLNSIAEKGKVKEVQKVFDTLVNANYCAPGTLTLAPLVKVHLVNDDLETALKIFEEFCQKYSVTPCKRDLMARLIKKEDAVGLQKLTDISTELHGEVNSLYDLAFSFVECDRPRQARKILETPGLQSRPAKIVAFCERHAQAGLTQPLEGLIEATLDLNHIDRMEIYYKLLLCYIKEDLQEKALGLWMNIQEENITPSDNFLRKLGHFLKKNGMEVPFVIPTATKLEVSTSTTNKPKIGSDEVKKDTKKSKNQAVYEKSRNIEYLVRQNELPKAKEQILDLLANNNSYPYIPSLRAYLNKAAEIGDIESFSQIGEHLNTQMKKTLSFDNRFCRAYIQADRCEEYFSRLEKELQGATTPEEIRHLSENFPNGGMTGILDTHPKYSDRFEAMAIKYAEANVLGPMNVLFCHHFITGNDKKANEIFQKYLQKENMVMFRKVIVHAREKNDVTLLRNLIGKLKTTAVTKGAIGQVYTNVIDIHARKEDLDDAVKVIQEAKDEVGLEKISRKVLLRVKEQLEGLKKEVPFTIPVFSKADETHDTSSSSSSSSSDDEVKEERKKN